MNARPLPASNGQLDILEAHSWGKLRIEKFFRDLGDNPGEHGIPSAYHIDARRAAGSFHTLSSRNPPFFQLNEAGVELHYEDFANPFTMYSIFDIMAWVFSIGCTPPASADIRTEFYYPLAAVYCKFCLAFRVIKRLPTMMSVMYFRVAKDDTRALFGAVLDSPGEDLKKDLQENRRLQMVRENLVQRQEDQAPQASRYPNQVGQKFGHCAETFPFMFFKRAQNHGLRIERGAVKGFAVSPVAYLKSRAGEENDNNVYHPGRLKDALFTPCYNCEEVIISRLGLYLPYFQPWNPMV